LNKKQIKSITYLTFILSVCAYSVSAFTQEKPTRSTIRTFVPVISFEHGSQRESQPSIPGLFVLWGFEVAHAWQGITVEGTYASIRNIEGKGRTVGLRGGYTFKIRERKRKRAQWRHYVLPFVGYRHVNLPEPAWDSYTHTHLAHTAHLGAGYGIERSGKRSFILRFNAGRDFALRSKLIPVLESEIVSEGDKLRSVEFFNISLGIAFYGIGQHFFAKH